MDMKVCNGCKEEKFDDQFYNFRSKICKNCLLIRDRKKRVSKRQLNGGSERVPQKPNEWADEFDRWVGHRLRSSMCWKCLWFWRHNWFLHMNELVWCVVFSSYLLLACVCAATSACRAPALAAAPSGVCAACWLRAATLTRRWNSVRPAIRPSATCSSATFTVRLIIHDSLQ